MRAFEFWIRKPSFLNLHSKSSSMFKTYCFPTRDSQYNLIIQFLPHKCTQLMLLFTISIRKFRAIKEAVKLQRNDGLVMNQLFSRKAFLPYSRLVCNFRHFGAFSELDFKDLSDLKTWMDYFAHPARSCEYLEKYFPA